jgi:UDP-glucose 4-epimerase
MAAVAPSFPISSIRSLLKEKHEMKYLVTGGAGFIGSHLCEYLLSQGHSVCLIDDLSTGAVANIAKIRGHRNLAYIFSSVLDRGVLAESIDSADVIVHLAASVGVRVVVESPVRTIENNVMGSEIVLRLAARKNKRVIITSTSEVYGKSNKVPFCEDDDIVIGPSTRGRWSYACSKALDEFLGLAYWREKKTPVLIARLFNTVGPRQIGRYGMVVPRFVRQALDSEPITVYGDGRQTRCFTDVADIVDGIARMSVVQTAGEIFNLGSNEEVTINELAELVRNITCSRSPIVHLPYEEAYGEGFEDMQRRVPSIEKASRVLGYRPTRNLREIIERIVEWNLATAEDPPFPGALVANQAAT